MIRVRCGSASRPCNIREHDGNADLILAQQVLISETFLYSRALDVLISDTVANSTGRRDPGESSAHERISWQPMPASTLFRLQRSSPQLRFEGATMSRFAVLPLVLCACVPVLSAQQPKPPVAQAPHV